MNWSIDFAPLVPLWLTAAFGAIGLALVVLAIARGVSAAWLRALAVAALAIALLNPVVVVEDREPLPTTVALVVDQSASQSLENRLAATEAAIAGLEERLGTLDGVEIRTITVRPGATGADGTEIFAAINAGLADLPPERVGAVIMVTDGQVHDVPVDAAFGAAPLHALVTGREDEIDRRLVIELAPRFGIVGESQEITYRIIDDGTDAGGTAIAVIYRDGVRIAGNIATIGESETFRFIVPHSGAMVLEIVAETIDGEITEANNGAVVELEGIRENLRVLLVSGAPHAGERTWRDLLKSDASVDLIHFTILRPPEKFDAAPQQELALIAFPTRELFVETLYDFDLVIFDRYQEQGALPYEYFDNIARYVIDGGALLVAAGPDDAGPQSIYSTGIADVLPVSMTGNMIEVPFYATITDLGLRHPVTRGLVGGASDPPDWSRWFRAAEVENPVGEVIMAGPDGAPLLVLGHEGDGRVAMLLSDHSWLWARNFEGGGPYVDLLRRITHWLMREPELEEEVLRATADNGALIIERQTMAADADPVSVRSPLGEVQDVSLVEVDAGLWRAEIAANDIGLWRIEDGNQIAVVHVGEPNPREFIDPISTEDLLEPLVDAGGGYIERVGEEGADIPRVAAVGATGVASGRDWLGVRMSGASTLVGIDRIALFAGFLGLAILAGLLAATWFREGR
jgi:hypothetical protein